PAVQRTTPELIAEINANNVLIRNLWSRLDIKVETPDEKHSVSGHLILRKPEYGQPPKDLLLKGGDSFGAAEFQLGSNSRGYWYTLKTPRNDPVHEFVAYGQDSAGPASQALDLLSVLGVYELPDKLDQEPWPVCRGYDEPSYYVISFIERTTAGSLRVRRDIWWNRRSQQVDLIELFDEHGQRYLSAALDDYRNFDGPKLATRIRITWFQEKLVLDLKLKDVQVNSAKVTDKNFQYRKPSWAD
ncbi:MAG: hypothetical protein GWP14_05860, partial [Actinobacteria bacterium]|nr:hypothetical protein [Actinomycetota bacterium]